MMFELVWPLLGSVAAGGVIGFEREWNTAEAGLRTHILVAMAAALFTVLAFEIYHTIDTGADGRQTGRDARFRTVGYYDPRSNITRDAQFRMVGTGNLLASLIAVHGEDH